MTNCALISTVKVPAEELSMFVHFHLNIGIDQIVLFFDDPEDPALSLFADNPKVSCNPCTEAYWQEQVGHRPESIEGRQTTNANFGLAQLKAQGCQWVIHIDSDELIWPQGSLQALLQDANADVVKFKVLEAASEQLAYKNIFEPQYFKQRPNRIQMWLAKLLGCRRAIFCNEYFRGHLASKSAYHIGGKIKKIGIHEPIDADGPIVTKQVNTICLLHFDCIGFDNWKRKWQRRLDGSGRADHMRANRNKQFELFKEAYQKGSEELEKLYTFMQVIPVHEKRILKALRMLVKVTLPEGIFRPSK